MKKKVLAAVLSLSMILSTGASAILGIKDELTEKAELVRSQMVPTAIGSEGQIRPPSRLLVSARAGNCFSTLHKNSRTEQFPGFRLLREPYP